MRKRYCGIMLCFVLGLAACAVRPIESERLPKPTGELLPTATADLIPEVTGEPEATTTSKVTEAPKPEITPTPAPSATPEPTGVPVATTTPAPTVTPKPTATPAPTATPKPTVTPGPIATPEPTKASKPTVTPAQKPGKLSPEIEALLNKAEEFKNVIMRGTVCSDETETNRYIWESAQKYSGFAVIVEDAGYLHSAAEYMEIYPEIESMKIDKIEIYRNGICAFLSDVTVTYDAKLCYAIRTGDFSVLTNTEKEVYRFLEKILEETQVKKSERYETVKVLHDYLVHRVTYDEEFQSISHTPEGVMRNNLAVCDGYTRTMRLLLLMAGIKCEIATGYAGGESHAWNLVKMEDGWYHVDVTWDDPVMPRGETTIQYHYFLKNDEDMKKTHTWESEISCTGEAYRMYVYQDVMCNSVEDVENVYDKQIATEEQLIFCYPAGGNLTQSEIMDYVMNRFACNFTYSPETEVSGYWILTITNPFLTGEAAE